LRKQAKIETLQDITLGRAKRAQARAAGYRTYRHKHTVKLTICVQCNAASSYIPPDLDPPRVMMVDLHIVKRS
jgi:hypothetical protein